MFWTGRVQGVGFRYTAESAALELGVTGWVRNLPDGRVEAIAEAPEKDLKTFLARIAQGPMKRYIIKAEVSWQEASGEFEDFRVRFY